MALSGGGGSGGVSQLDVRGAARENHDRRVVHLAVGQRLESAAAALAEHVVEVLGLAPGLELLGAGLVGAYQDRVEHGLAPCSARPRTERFAAAIRLACDLSLHDPPELPRAASWSAQAGGRVPSGPFGIRHYQPDVAPREHQDRGGPVASGAVERHELSVEDREKLMVAPVHVVGHPAAIALTR